MDGTVPTVLRTERRVVLGTLVSLAAIGWGLVAWQAARMDTMEDRLDLTMGMAAPLFLVMWIAMMVAMMFPASAPMILAYARTQSAKRADGRPYVPTAFFVAPYLAVWTVFGMLGFGVARVTAEVAGDSMWAMDNLPRIAGALLVAAGVYQLTPLKRVCLRRCRTPLAFLLSHWRDGRAGAMSMGVRHGLYCLGCCWVLFLVLLPIGVMNVAAMVAVAALVFAEKVMLRGELVANVAAVALVAYGALAVLVPAALPTVM